MMRLFILILLSIGWLSGCTLHPQNHPPPFEHIHVPGYPLQDIPVRYRGVPPDIVKEDIMRLRRLRSHLDLYIKRLHEDILNERYSTHTERDFRCESLIFQPVKIPVIPLLKDDGSLSDTAIIKSLVSYISSMKRIIADFNKDVDLRKAKWNMECRNDH